MSIERDPFIRVVAKSADDARRFVGGNDIERVEDGGPAPPPKDWPAGVEYYSQHSGPLSEARVWHVYTTKKEDSK